MAYHHNIATVSYLFLRFTISGGTGRHSGYHEFIHWIPLQNHE